MPTIARALLYARALRELIRFDLLFAHGGLRSVRLESSKSVPAQAAAVAMESTICEAVRSVIPLYWKPVRCLQRSVVTARLMQQRGIRAEVVIGYRAAPFFGHAWVEVGGRAVSDSPIYQTRLQVLDRI